VRHRLIIGVLAAALLGAPVAHADDEPPPKTPQPVAVVAAVVPGVLLHGSGHFALGEKRTAYRLLALDGAGLVALVGGGATFRLSGAARNLATPAVGATLIGASLLVGTWLADLYGVVLPGSAKGDVLRTAPVLEAEMTTTYAAGPTVAAALHVGTAVTARLGPMAIELGTNVAPAERYDRVEAGLAYRPFGATPGRPSADGGFFELGAVASRVRHGALGFDVTGVDLVTGGRLDLVTVGRTLRGTFAELSGGAAVRSLTFDHGGTSARPDLALLLQLAFGVSFGRFGDPFRGEAKFYYDHRHDDDAGGILGIGRVSGVFGHVGLSGLFLSRSGWGARAYGEIGEAGVVGLSLLYRVGGGR